MHSPAQNRDTFSQMFMNKRKPKIKFTDVTSQFKRDEPSISSSKKGKIKNSKRASIESSKSKNCYFI